MALNFSSPPPQGKCEASCLACDRGGGLLDTLSQDKVGKERLGRLPGSATGEEQIRGLF